MLAWGAARAPSKVVKARSRLGHVTWGHGGGLGRARSSGGSWPASVAAPPAAPPAADHHRNQLHRRTDKEVLLLPLLLVVSVIILLLLLLYCILLLLLVVSVMSVIYVCNVCKKDFNNQSIATIAIKFLNNDLNCLKSHFNDISNDYVRILNHNGTISSLLNRGYITLNWLNRLYRTNLLTRATLQVSYNVSKLKLMYYQTLGM
jgi:hypothetical protein